MTWQNAKKDPQKRDLSLFGIIICSILYNLFKKSKELTLLLLPYQDLRRSYDPQDHDVERVAVFGATGRAVDGAALLVVSTTGCNQQQ